MIKCDTCGGELNSAGTCFNTDCMNLHTPQYTELEALPDAMGIHGTVEGLVVDEAAILVDKLGTLLGTIGMSLDCLGDDGMDAVVDKQKLQLVVNILLNRLDDTMRDIIDEEIQDDGT